MTNYEFWGDAETARKMYDKRESLLEPNGGDHMSIERWLYCAADFALQAEPGEILQMNEGTKEEPHLVYFLVEHPDCVLGRFDRLLGKSAAYNSSSMLRYEIKGGICGRGEIPLANEFKRADIPADFVRLAKCPNLDRCPLKDEGACMKGGENE